MRRKTLLAGAVLALTAMLAVGVGTALDLDLESVALLGAAMGAVVALVPDRTPAIRLGGFAIGFVIAWVGYFVRAQFMPDTSTGRAVAVGIVVIVCVAVAALSADRITLWTILLGAGAFAGAYEFTYSAEPPEIVSSSLTTATTMAFTVGLGFLAGVIAGPLTGAAPSAPQRRTEPKAPAAGDRVDAPEDRTPLDALLTETAR